MTLHYLDASAWVKRYESERGTEWLGEFWRSGVRFACSRLGLVEVVSAISRRHAGRRAESEAKIATIRTIEADFSRFTCVEVADEILSLAGQLVQSHCLRAADAIHLASASRLREMSEAEVTVVTSDAELLEAAEAEGFAVLDPQTREPPSPTV